MKWADHRAPTAFSLGPPSRLGEAERSPGLDSTPRPCWGESGPQYSPGVRFRVPNPPWQPPVGLEVQPGAVHRALLGESLRPQEPLPAGCAQASTLGVPLPSPPLHALGGCAPGVKVVSVGPPACPVCPPACPVCPPDPPLPFSSLKPTGSWRAKELRGSLEQRHQQGVERRREEDGSPRQCPAWGPPRHCGRPQLLLVPTPPASDVTGPRHCPGPGVLTTQCSGSCWLPVALLLNAAHSVPCGRAIRVSGRVPTVGPQKLPSAASSWCVCRCERRGPCRQFQGHCVHGKAQQEFKHFFPQRIYIQNVFGETVCLFESTVFQVKNLKSMAS